MSEAVSGWGSRLRAISSKDGDLTVDGCTFIGNSSYTNTRAIIFGEGGVDMTVDTDISITNSTFIDWVFGVIDNENAKDVANVTIEGNEFTNASVNVSAYTSVKFNNNVMNNSWATITSYAAEPVLDVVANGNTLADNTASNNNSVSKFATSDVQDGFLTPVVMVGSKSYFTLADAIAKAANGSIIVVLENIALDSPITVAEGKVLTLDLNEKTVSYASDVMGEAMLTNKGDLTIVNGTFTYTYNGVADSSYGKGNYTIYNYGKLTVDATILNETAAMSHAYYTINNADGAEVIVNGGLVENKTSYAIRQVSFNSTNLNKVVVNDGEVKGKRAVWIQLPGNNPEVAYNIELTVNGGILTSTDSTYNLAIYSYSYGNSLENVVINVNGGTLNGDIALTGGTNKDIVETVNITGGTFTGDYGVYSYSEDDAAAQTAISITGGTFKTDYPAYYATDDGYEFVLNNEGSYSVVEGATFEFDGEVVTIKNVTGLLVLASYDNSGALIDVETIAITENETINVADTELVTSATTMATLWNSLDLMTPCFEAIVK